MARLRDIIQRGTRASQPAATTVDVGTLYYVTDELITERSDGTNWQSYNDGASGSIYILKHLEEGAAVTTGIKAYLSIPVSGAITKVRLFGGVSGSVVLDIFKDTFANFPPTVADTITASAKPTLSSSQSFEDTTLTGWTVGVTAGDVIAFNVDSASLFGFLTIELEITIT